MNAAQIIALKRDRLPLSTEQIEWFVQAYTDGSIPDYQMASLSMAICIHGMDKAEIRALTIAMLKSGVTLSWPNDARPRVDKHSTGGIGDKVSLILAPLLACCDVWVPMISGRGLGITGGTLDKLESIKGFRTDLSLEELQRLTEQVGCVITGTTKDIAPADRKLYALRDVTATVPSIPLITASIMSKKLAEGLSTLVLDVKCGGGGVVRNQADARALAESLVEVGNAMGINATALITDMNQPLGKMVGNAVEVNEAVALLQGEGPEDLREVTLALGAEVLISSQLAADEKEARRRLTELLESGQASDKFSEMVCAQGGNLEQGRDVAAPTSILAKRGGYVSGVDAAQLGRMVVQLGGGRQCMSDQIDYAVGLEMRVRIGDAVEEGEELLRVFARKEVADPLVANFRAAIAIHDEVAGTGPLILERVQTVGRKEDE